MSLNNLGNSNDCIFLADSYSHISTPSMVMTSAADTNTLLDICALEEPINNNFLQVRNKQDQTFNRSALWKPISQSLYAPDTSDSLSP